MRNAIPTFNINKINKGSEVTNEDHRKLAVFPVTKIYLIRKFITSIFIKYLTVLPVYPIIKITLVSADSCFHF